MARMEPAPFASPKASQASEHGIDVAYANTPPPTMKLRGECSLKRNSSPGVSARKGLPDGAQKFSSANPGRWRRNSNQSPSVTAITKRMLIPRHSPKHGSFATIAGAALSSVIAIMQRDVARTPTATRPRPPARIIPAMPSHRRALLGLAIVCLGALLSPLDTTVNTAFPVITEAFSLPLADIQWVVIPYVLSQAIFAIVFGHLGDRFGHRRIFALGLL